MNKIKENIKESFVENKYIILFSAFLLIFTLILGYFLEPYLYNVLNPVVDKISNDVHNGTIKLTFSSIFLNNILIVFRLFIFGLGLCFSNIILAYNGLFLGYFIASCENLTGTLLLIVPHGIFELPSIIIANASGLVLFKFLIKTLTFKNIFPEGKDEPYFKKLYESAVENGKYLKQALILLVISSILMIIAGIVEVYFTQNLANYFIGLFK